ncbi:MAG: NAD(P)H-hydrate dehydratase [Synergistales bacterium]
MTPFYAADAIREADRLAVEKIALNFSLLMENAGRGAAEALTRRFGKLNWTILCGPGNNGGDGFVAARHLALAGSEVTVILSEAREKIRSEPAFFLRNLEKTRCRIEQASSMEDESLLHLLEKSGGIIDALLGTGSSGHLRGGCARLLSLVPPKGPLMISLDVPTGVDPSSGVVSTVAFRADLTLTFLAPKIGLRVMPGAAFAGKIEVIGIGIPDSEILPPPEVVGYGPEDAARDWPAARFDDHKGRKGTVLVLGGSERYRGAPLLAGRASLRSGAGLAVLIVPECIARTASVSLPEAIVLPSSGKDETSHDADLAISLLKEWAEKANALVLGPGLGRNEASHRVTEWVSRFWTKPVLLDADALHNLTCKVESPSSLITPHEGEAGRLLDKDPRSVALNRLENARELGRKFGAVLLKGPYSLCCDGTRTGLVLESTPSLAIPGSGDVLSGIGGTLLARELAPWSAGLAAAWLHARTGSLLSNRRGSTIGLLATEIADNLHLSLKQLFPLSADREATCDVDR